MSVSEAAVSQLSLEKRGNKEENVQEKIKGQPSATQKPKLVPRSTERCKERTESTQLPSDLTWHAWALSPAACTP